MTAAQKSAKEKFKKAIAYRKKTGCTLKQAFANIYGKKTVGAIKKKSAPKKKAATKKKAIAKKSGSLHKDTQSHNVKIHVVSGIKINRSKLYHELEQTWFKILNEQDLILKLKKVNAKEKDKQLKKITNLDIKRSINYVKELKMHHKELKKLL